MGRQRRNPEGWWSVGLGECSGRRWGLGMNNCSVLKGLIGRNQGKPMKHNMETFAKP